MASKAGPAAASFAPTIAGVVLACAWAFTMRSFVGELTHDAGPLLRLAVNRPWTAFGIGACIGVAAACFEAWHISRNAPFFVRRLIETPRPGRYTAVNVLAWLPSVAAVTLAAFVAAVAGWAVPMAIFGALAPVALTYPVERRIHRLAANTKPNSG